MPAEEDIAAAIGRMRTTHRAARTLKALGSELRPGETVHELATAFHLNANGILAATDQRLLFFSKGLLGSTSESFPYSDIASFAQHDGPLLSVIALTLSGQHGYETVIRSIPKPDAERVARAVRAALEGRSVAQTAQRPTPSAALGVHEELLKLKQLHDAGILDDATYRAKADPLIDRL